MSGPYRADDIEGVQDNIYRARKVAVELWKMGFAVICPHTNTANFPNGAGELDKGKQDIKYIEGDLEFISRLYSSLDVIVMLPGWINSDGSKQELNCAKYLAIEDYYWPEDKEKLRELAEVIIRK